MKAELFVIGVLGALYSLTGVSTQGTHVFRNPISDQVSADPSLIRWRGYYYMVLSMDERNMVVYKSDKMTDFRGAPANIIVRPNSTYDQCWAPELHEINGEIYCYFSLHKIGENDHRMWVTKAVNSSDLMGDWTEPIQLMPDEAEDANDGTVFQHPTNGKMYFVFTRLRVGILVSSLFIAPMPDPYTVSHPRVLLRIPYEDQWDCLDRFCLNEGAHMLVAPNNLIHLVYSGSMSGSKNYALARLTIEPHMNPLDPNGWARATGPLFKTNETELIYGPGHATFVLSPDGTETWMCYHAQNTPETDMRARYAYLDKITFDADGYPVFPQAHGPNSVQTVPSGVA